MKTILTRVCVLIGILAAASYAEVMTHRGNYEIILPPSPSHTQQTAAAELSTFLEKNYTEPLQVNGDVPQAVRFYVGFPGAALFDGFDDIDIVGRPENWEFGIYRRGSNFLLTGRDESPDSADGGTVRAVYYFLSRYAGVRFYVPGDAGIALNVNRPIVFDGRSDEPIPSFKVRSLRCSIKQYRNDEQTLFARRNLCYVPTQYAPRKRYEVRPWPKRFAESHPEYLAMIDGKRSGVYPNHIPCTSNPDVVRQAASDVIDLFNANGDLQTVSLFCDGPFNPCQCDLCARSPQRANRHGRNGSDEFFTFVTRIADQVAMAWPDKHLSVLTKRGLYCQPPTTTKWNPVCLSNC